MENASKALLIAGGIFLAILILSAMMYMASSITSIGEAQENKKAAEQLAAFNAQYEAYDKQLMYGTDIVTVINKAYEDGITIKLNGIEVTSSDFTLDEVKINMRAAKLDASDATSGYEPLKIYKSTGNIGYDDITGKVKSMEFVER